MFARAPRLLSFRSTVCVKEITRPSRHINYSQTALGDSNIYAASSQSAIMAPVKIALVQMRVTPHKEENYATAQEAIQKAAKAGASLIVLPEIWNSAYETTSFPKNAEDVDAGTSRSAEFLAESAKKHSITLIGGSIPELSRGNTYNTCLVYGKNGKLLAKHRKVHLFDIDIPGKQTFKESDTLTAGETLTVVDTEEGRLGIGICYDLRFPEMAAIYARKGVQLIVYPGAFNTTTGPLHWELLQRARAVDNQLFVATCSPAANPDASYSVYGHSMVVSPWGEILGRADAEPTIIYADLDFTEISTRRTYMPLSQQRRTDLYDVQDKSSES